MLFLFFFIIIVIISFLFIYTREGKTNQTKKAITAVFVKLGPDVVQCCILRLIFLPIALNSSLLRTRKL